MAIIDVIPEVGKFFVLTSSGELGAFGEDKEFVVDGGLSKIFDGHSKDLLRAYLKDPKKRDYRIAIIYPARTSQPWRSATLVLEDDALKLLYPVSGTKGGELTSFQKKQRERSIYQGVELLLNYENEIFPGSQIFCPVLFNRHTTLDQYAALLARESQETDRETPVIEVLNLAANFPLGRRADPIISDFVNRIRTRAITAQKRESSRFTLVDNVKSRAPGDGAGSVSADPYAGEDDREIQDLVMRLSGQSASLSYEDWFSSHCEPQTRALIHRWMTKPYEYLEPEALRTFTRFQGLDQNSLGMLAIKNPIFSAPTGAKLLARGTQDKWNLYLLDGELSLEAADGAHKEIDGAKPSAKLPVSYLKPRKYTVTAVAPVRFLWMYEPMIEAVYKLNDRRNKFRLGSDLSL